MIYSPKPIVLKYLASRATSLSCGIIKKVKETINKLKNKVIVSVQAQDNEPLNKPEHLLVLAQSVVNGGAGGLRLCGIENIKLITKNVNVPVIGLTKSEPTPINWLDKVYITAAMKDLKELVKTNIEFVAIDGTNRPRADNSMLKDQVELLQKEGKIVIADVSTLEEGINSAELGAHVISTTLSGYTKETRYKINEGPDYELLSDLTRTIPIPIILEGRIWEPHEVKEAFEIGAFAVVIGSAITRPHLITKRFVSVMPSSV